MSEIPKPGGPFYYDEVADVPADLIERLRNLRDDINRVLGVPLPSDAEWVKKRFIDPWANQPPPVDADAVVTRFCAHGRSTTANPCPMCNPLVRR